MKEKVAQNGVTKIVVFDLDETLGYFVEFGMFWDALKSYFLRYHRRSLSQMDFNDLLDIYPECLRPNILDILQFLMEKKKTTCCSHIMIYTNNQGPKEWAEQIKAYFEGKLNYRLFDQIVAAFKVNGQRVEVCRTSNSKTHHDFIRCTKLPKDAEICFVDDTYYPDMTNSNVYYINVKPYINDIPFQTMIERLLVSEWFARNVTDDKIVMIASYIDNFLKRYNYNLLHKDESDYNIDKILSKKIMNHLNIFFLT